MSVKLKSIIPKDVDVLVMKDGDIAVVTQWASKKSGLLDPYNYIGSAKSLD